MFTSLYGEEEDDGSNEASAASSFMNSGNGSKTPPSPRAHFVGLRNQGATCYLNSLLQSMYMTPELRDRLNVVDPVAELGALLVSTIEKKYFFIFLKVFFVIIRQTLFLIHATSSFWGIFVYPIFCSFLYLFLYLSIYLSIYLFLK